jgi:hypothetical protein
VLLVECPGIHHAYNVREKSTVAHSLDQSLARLLKTVGIGPANCCGECPDIESRLNIPRSECVECVKD